MPIVRRSRTDIARKRLLTELAAGSAPSEEQIERWADEDGSALTDVELADMVPVYPPPAPADVRALRARLGLSQSQFATMFGFTIDTVQQDQQGRRTPSGPASTLLRVIAREPQAVLRALDPRRARKASKVAASG